MQRISGGNSGTGVIINNRAAEWVLGYIFCNTTLCNRTGGLERNFEDHGGWSSISLFLIHEFPTLQRAVIYVKLPFSSTVLGVSINRILLSKVVSSNIVGIRKWSHSVLLMFCRASHLFWNCGTDQVYVIKITLMLASVGSKILREYERALTVDISLRLAGA